VKRAIDRCKKNRSDLMWAACTLAQIDRLKWGLIGTKAMTKETPRKNQQHYDPCRRLEKSNLQSSTPANQSDVTGRTITSTLRSENYSEKNNP
jgi:hypothetical protein